MIKLSKTLTALLLAVFLVLGTVSQAFAESSYNSYYALIDEAEIFSDADAASIQSDLETVGKQTGWQMIVLTTERGISSDSMETSYDNYFYSDSRLSGDAVMFVIDDASSNRIILAYGEAQRYFTDERMSSLKSALLQYLNSGDMAGASSTFAKGCADIYSSGIPASKSANPLVRSLRFWWAYLLAGLIVFAAFILINRGRYKNMGKSGTYDLRANSELKLLDSQDVFLHKHTTYVTLNSGSGSSGGSSGGSGGTHSSGSF